MNKLILNPTDLAQWHALINEASAKRALCLPPDLESYLVFLLMRFSVDPEVTSNIIAIDFLKSQQSHGQVRMDSLRKVGDECLLVSGLFPDLAAKRQVSPSYFADIGRAAYYALSAMDDHPLRALFMALCQEFQVMADILQATRQLTPLPNVLPSANDQAAYIDQLAKHKKH